jgi:hypothetical protein
MSRDTVTKTYSLPPDVAEAVKSKAAELGLPESTMVLWALRQYLGLKGFSVSGQDTKTKKGKKS